MTAVVEQPLPRRGYRLIHEDFADGRGSADKSLVRNSLATAAKNGVLFIQ